MALVAVSNGQSMTAPQVQQIIDLLTGVMNDQVVTLLHTAGNPLTLGRTEVAAAAMAHLAAQRNGTTKWWLGLDASDQFALFTATFGTVNFGVTDLGAGTFRAGLTIGTGTTFGVPAVIDMRITGLAALLGGTTGFGFTDNANSRYNVTWDDTGLFSLRNALKIPPVAGGTLSPTSYGTVPVKITEQSGSALTTYDFTSIPAGFRELEFRYYLRDTSATNGISNCLVTFNNDSTGTYYVESQQIKGVAATLPAEGLASTGISIWIVGGGSTAGLHSAGHFRIPGYLQGGLKTFTDLHHTPTATTTGNQNIFITNGWWNSTSAITRVTWTPPTGPDANSYIELWGIP